MLLIEARSWQARSWSAAWAAARRPAAPALAALPLTAPGDGAEAEREVA